MARIEIEDTSPIAVTLAMTLLRSITGVAIAASGMQKLQDLEGWQADLTRLGVPSAVVVAPWLAGGALVVGAGLALGWLTRMWSSILLATSGSAVALVIAHGAIDKALEGSFVYLDGIEYLFLLGAVSLLLLTTGAGRLSADRWLFERRRRRAILSDRLWSYPPYVPGPPARGRTD